jgi:hypothetical protein
MVTEACICSEGFGLPHDHLVEWQSNAHASWSRPDGNIRMWVNWKEVAKGLCEPTTDIYLALGTERSNMTPTSNVNRGNA